MSDRAPDPRDLLVATVIALAAVKSLGGIIAVPGFFLMSVYGFDRFVRTQQVFVPAMVYLAAVWVVFGLQMLTNVAVEPIRYVQLSLMTLFLTAILVTKWVIVRTSLRLCSMLLGVGLAFDFALKADFRRALGRLDLQYFLDSGGAAEDSGVQLIAAGNVYAGVLAGAVGLALYLDNSRGLAAATIAIGLLTGSRTLMTGLLLVAILANLPIAKRSWRRLVVTALLVTCSSLPFLIGLVRGALDAGQNARLAEYSGRYNAFDTFARLGFDHPFGVGIFNGKTFESYFLGNQRSIDGHNMFMGTFAEFGWVGYAGLIFLVVAVGRIAINNAKSTVLFCYLIYAFNFVDGYFAWTFWFGMALVVHFAHESSAAGVDGDLQDGPVHVLAQRTPAEMPAGSAP